MFLKKFVGTVLFCITKDIWIIALTALLMLPFGLFTPPWVTILVLCYVCNLFRASRKWPALRRFPLFKYLRENLFAFRCIFQTDAEEKFLFSKQDRPVLWALHPHGTVSYTAVFFFVLNHDTAHIRPAVHSGGFYTPFFAVLCAWFECIHVSREGITEALQKGEQVFLSPGGLLESCYTGDEYVKRDGFLKIAMETGALVIPVWFPEERAYFKQWLPLGHSLVPWLAMPFPFFVWGKNWCPLLPRTHEITESRIMVGTAIDPTKCESIDALKAEFTAGMDAIIALSKVN
jgi:hypothetical protein